jgi:hypothetical protein
MELRFLGQTYSTSNVRLETETTNQTGHFLGQKYDLRSPILTTKPQLGVKKYRGVVYSA